MQQPKGKGHKMRRRSIRSLEITTPEITTSKIAASKIATSKITAIPPKITSKPKIPSQLLDAVG